MSENGNGGTLSLSIGAADIPTHTPATVSGEKMPGRAGGFCGPLNDLLAKPTLEDASTIEGKQ
jgi:hypothetical protein